VLAGTLWFLLGMAGLGVALGIAAADLLGAPPRWPLAAAVILLAFVPVAVLAAGLPAPELISIGFARNHRLADGLAKAGMALLVVGVLREVWSSPADAAFQARTGVPGPDVDQA
jgi:hypothetical protein